MATKADTKKETLNELGTAEVPVEVVEAVQPDLTPQMLVERAFSGRERDPRVAAFVHVERLRSHGRIRKMTREAWEAEFAVFLAEPRR